MAYGAQGDFAAQDLQRPALDLSDRGIDGRHTPGDIDAYVYTERGVYRPGETVRLIGLIRDQIGRAIRRLSPGVRDVSRRMGIPVFIRVDAHRAQFAGAAGARD